jgi:hypothetical protein
VKPPSPSANAFAGLIAADHVPPATVPENAKPEISTHTVWPSSTPVVVPVTANPASASAAFTALVPATGSTVIVGGALAVTVTEVL